MQKMAGGKMGQQVVKVVVGDLPQHEVPQAVTPHCHTGRSTDRASLPYKLWRLKVLDTDRSCFEVPVGLLNKGDGLRSENLPLSFRSHGKLKLAIADRA